VLSETPLPEFQAILSTRQLFAPDRMGKRKSETAVLRRIDGELIALRQERLDDRRPSSSAASAARCRIFSDETEWCAPIHRLKREDP
jgi:hypothetical protein